VTKTRKVFPSSRLLVFPYSRVVPILVYKSRDRIFSHDFQCTVLLQFSRIVVGIHPYLTHLKYLSRNSSLLNVNLSTIHVHPRNKLRMVFVHYEINILQCEQPRNSHGTIRPPMTTVLSHTNKFATPPCSKTISMVGMTFLGPRTRYHVNSRSYHAQTRVFLGTFFPRRRY
jgi:hypothetical protein